MSIGQKGAPHQPTVHDVHADAGAGRRLAERTLSLSTLLGAAAILVALAGAAGAVLNFPLLERVHETLPPMSLLSAFALILGGLAVLLSRGVDQSAARAFVAGSLAAIVVLIGFLVLLEYVSRLDLGIDRPFAIGPAASRDPYPGRPSVQAAISFMLLGASLLALQSSRAPILVAQVGAMLVAASGVVALTGYIFDAEAFSMHRRGVPLIGISVPTALSFVLLSLALLCSRPTQGVMSLITSDSNSGTIARRIVLTLILGPPLVGAMTLMGAIIGWYQVGAQASLFILGLLGLVLWSTWQAARLGERSERLAKTANAATLKARDDFEALAARVHALFQQAPDGIFVADLDGHCIEVNDAGARMLGYSREELLGMRTRDVLAPADIERLPEMNERLLRGESEFGEWALRRKDGRYFPVEISAKLLPDGRFQAVVRDIGERKRIEHELRYSEAKSSGIVSISADAIILIDEKQNIALFNEGAQRIFGYSKAEATGAPLDMLIPERFRAVHRQHVAGFAAGPDQSRFINSRAIPIVGLRKSGEEFPADAAISKLTIGNERILAVSVRDITKQKHAENEQRYLSDVGAELASTLDLEETLEIIASLAATGIADLCVVDLVDADGKPHERRVAVRDQSKKWACEVLARAPFDREPDCWTPTILKAKRPTLVGALPPETVSGFAQTEEQREAWRAIAPISMITVPLWARGAVAAVLALFASSPRMFRSDDARLAREFGYRAAGALENALLYRELRQAIKTREDVLAIVSHDLRNPLMVIMSAVRRLGSTGLAKQEDSQRFMNALAVSADQMRRLIDDLLDFSRMESGTFSIRKTAAYASDLIAETVEGMRSQAETRRQTIVADVPATLPEIECDARRMGQALSNLLGNAIKFTPEGGVIQVSARVQRGELVVTVRDFGPGIPPEHLSHIFDRYWQAEETKMMGAGLGLFIAKGIVEAHNGRIWAESDMGEGSSFHFAVPLEKVDNRLSHHSQPSGTS